MQGGSLLDASARLGLLVRESGSWRIDSFQLPPEMAASFRPRPDVFPLHLRDAQLFCGMVSVMRARARPEFG